ncbi:MAG: aerobic respiration control sensor protein ArcB [Syntrophorhabdus sp. PtaB.Bin184]|nr:MAG: aerobic respiration control sensor protein ArcB [Syntrophorhabdus sp. PtaB.Bin184]
MRHSRTILLVENEARNAWARGRALEECGYSVVVAASGEEAVEKVRSGADIDLVVADIDLGTGMSGPEAAQAIIAEKDIPVLLCFHGRSFRQDNADSARDTVWYGCAMAVSGEARLETSVRTVLEAHGARGRMTGRDAAEGDGSGRDRYRALMDQASDAIIIADVKGNFLEVNRRAAELLGYTKKELVGMTPLDIHPKEERERVAHHFAGIAAGQIEGLYDTSVLTKNGDVIPVDITGSPVKYAGRTLVQGIFRDITDHKRMEEELKMHRDHLGKLVADRTARIREEVARRKKKEEQYLALVESVREWIWETDGDFVHTYVSPRVYDVLGYSPEEVIGKSLFDFIPPEETTRALPVLKDLIARKQPFAAFQTMTRHKEGHSIYVQASGIPYFDEAGNLLGYRGSCQDITEQKNMMNALKERERELVAKSQTLEEVNAALKVLLKQREEDRKELEGKFVSNIKEMILPYILKMQKGQRDPRVKAYLDIVTANLNEIISPFLNTIRQLNLTPREIEVASFIREGRTTKEIAQILGVATSAVDSHRNNMRIKLGLNKKKINLRSYLLSLK